MNKCWLSIGGNMGNRMAFLNSAEDKINKQIGNITSLSKIYESEAWGVKNQNSFLNKVIMIESKLLPLNVLEKCIDIEKILGRERLEKWTKRVIDIDILYYKNEIIHTKNLIIPHPEIQNRRFVLKPLCEISQDYIHPILNKPNTELLEKCKDGLKVWEYNLN